MDERLKKLEEILKIRFEEHNYKKEQENTYKTYRSDSNISELKLKGVTIDHLDLLLPFAKTLHHLTFSNCTIRNIQGLVQFRVLGSLTLDNVSINYEEELANSQVQEASYLGMLRVVSFREMHIRNLGFLLAIGKKINQLSFTGCTISNIYEINLFPRLYRLNLNRTVIEQLGDHPVIPQPSDDFFGRMEISNMNFEDIDLFLPIANYIGSIDIYNCQIGSIQKLSEFPRLRALDIDSDSIIKDQKPAQNPSLFLKLHVDIQTQYEDEEEKIKTPFDFKNLASIAHHITKLDLDDSSGRNMDFLKCFPQLQELEFSSCEVLLGNFLPVAHRIKSIYFNESRLDQAEFLKHFEALEQIKTLTFREEKAVGDLKKLLPLKNQLKRLGLNEDEVENLDLIDQFTTLESLEITVESLGTAKHILSFDSLKKLNLSLRFDPEPNPLPILQLAGLRNIEELHLGGDAKFEGLGNLQDLRRLEIDFECDPADFNNLKKLEYLSINDYVDVNRLPHNPSLKTLILDVCNEYEVGSLEQFPNLERLKIESTDKINLGKLPKLKTLVVHQIDLENTSSFDNLPSLEELDLSNNELSVVKNLGKLTNLKTLSFNENYDIENIDGLENLKKLEYLDLYDNKVSDIRVLNKLPNLKEVNLAGNRLSEDEAYKQLNNPKIACFLYRPRVLFFIWRTDYFEL